MGGLIRSQNVRGDLWMIEGESERLESYPVMTTSEGPGPRVGHASLLVGNAFIGRSLPTPQSTGADGCSFWR
jgi:hypothetical protein